MINSKNEQIYELQCQQDLVKEKGKINTEDITG